MTTAVAVCGCGHWGRNLVRVFDELGALRRICDPQAAHLGAVAARHPAAETTDSHEAILADASIDAVVLATPAETHYELAGAALRAGKHVFVEKPLALHCAEARELIALAAAKRRVLMVGHLLRYHPAVIALKELCEAGELGKIEYAYSNRLNLGKIRREENALWSFAPHDISVLLHLCDGLPVQVTSAGGAYLQPGIADVSLSSLLFPGGRRAHIFVSWLHPYKEQRLVVVGSKKMAVFDDLARDRLCLYDKDIELVDGSFKTRKPEARAVKIDDTEPLKNECVHFLECVANGATPRTDGEEGLRVLRVLEACFDSMQSNGEPVMVEAVEDRA